MNSNNNLKNLKLRGSKTIRYDANRKFESETDDDSITEYLQNHAMSRFNKLKETEPDSQSDYTTPENSEEENSEESDTKEEKDNSKEIERVYKDYTTKEFCKTDILNKLNFRSKLDEYVFNSLPLTNSQKEELLLLIYADSPEE